LKKTEAGNAPHGLHKVSALSPEWQQFHEIMKVSLFELKDDEQYDPHFQDSYRCRDDSKPFNRVQLLLQFNKCGVGIATLDIYDDGQAVMRGVAVRKDARGAGHGRALGELVSDYARAAGIKSLVVNADPEKTGYYAKLGFREQLWSREELADWDNGIAISPRPVQMVKPLK
jgi:GNAT superfamily N-acetyltransferase